MAVAEPKADVPGVTRPMTYEEYLASPEEMARYDILDGWKVYRLYGEQQLPNPTIRHQEIVGNVLSALRAYAREQQRGLAVVAPCDVRIQKRPARTRQPDVLFISRARFGDRSLDTAAPLEPAPELVVEVLSPSDTPAVLAAKLADYQAVNVQEAWVVRAGTQSVDIVRLTAEGTQIVATYVIGEMLQSEALPQLSVSVTDIFA